MLWGFFQTSKSADALSCLWYQEARRALDTNPGEEDRSLAIKPIIGFMQWRWWQQKKSLSSATIVSVGSRPAALVPVVKHLVDTRHPQWEGSVGKWEQLAKYFAGKVSQMRVDLDSWFSN